MKKDLRHIMDSKLFVGSGTEGLYDEKLRTVLDDFGQYGVDYGAGEDESVTKIIQNSDESLREDAIAEAAFSQIPGIKYNDKLGYYLDLYVGSVIEGSYRNNGSSGGFVSWVASRLLEDGKIDGFVHVKKTNKPGLLFDYEISRTIDEIQAGAKSRYYPVELSRVLKEIQEKPGKYAIVGVPEIIMEVRLLAENNPTIKERIKYYFGLVCGHQKTTKYAEAIAWEYGIQPGDLEDIDFRFKKETGTAIEYDMKFTGLVQGKKNTFIVRNNEPFVSSWAHGFFKARFSDFTDNAFNEVADITFGDAWLDEYVGDPKGNNILIVRNSEIAQLIRRGVKGGKLKVDEVDEGMIIRSQQGLVHHTRDELPYRLYKEIQRRGWAPIKRVMPSNDLEKHRKKVQDARQKIAEKSHTYYKKAVAKNDFDYFRRKMQPYVDKYRRLYNQPVSGRNKPIKADGAILTLTGYFNYGNVIQRYALQQFLRKNGYNFLSYVDSYSAPRDIYKLSKIKKLKTPLRAIVRFMNYQKPYWYIPSYSDIYPEARGWENIIDFVNKKIWVKPFDPNDNYRNYIVGSDQVWRNWWDDREKLGYYFFSALKGKKANRVAYAVSFGKDKIDEVMSGEEVEYIRPYIEKINSISVREKTGTEIIENTWGMKNVKKVVDPTLLLNASNYSMLIDESAVKYEKIQPIFTYILGETPEIEELIRRIQDERRQAVTRVRAHAGSEGDVLPPVEFWLKGFRDAELVVTNSFHGMMFSIINQTDFIVIGREIGGLSRIKDFLSEYGIEGRFVSESDMVSFDISTLQEINWKKVHKKLSRSIKESGEWLLNSIKD